MKPKFKSRDQSRGGERKAQQTSEIPRISLGNETVEFMFLEIISQEA